ncbi:hypothetical protein WEI85_12065 [Actinomycetes bacterium KLBMP 9797]
MSRVFSALLATVGLTAGVLVGSAGPAQAQICTVYPMGRTAPVFAEPTTDSKQIDEVTYDRLGSGCDGRPGAPYDICDSGAAGAYGSWVYIYSIGGYSPYHCVELVW